MKEEILLLLRAVPEGCTLQDINMALGVPKQELDKLLKTLISSNLIVKEGEHYKAKPEPKQHGSNILSSW